MRHGILISGHNLFVLTESELVRGGIGNVAPKNSYRKKILAKYLGNRNRYRSFHERLFVVKL